MADPFAGITEFYKRALERFGDDVLALASIMSGHPSRFGLATLPGHTDAEKADYLLDYLDEGSRTGLSAFDMIDAVHDAGLRRANPVPFPGGPPVRDARRAARISFRGAEGTLDRIEGALTRDKIYTPEEFVAAPQYGTFWKKYGMGG